MSNLFAFDLPTIVLLSIAALVATAQTLRYARANRRLLAALQLPCALLLAAALLLRDDVTEDTLVVLTAGAEMPMQSSSPHVYVALPGGPAPRADSRLAIEFTPDLATALRKHPSVSHVHIIGGGLEPHDRDALGDRALSYAPAATSPRSTPAIIALDPPRHVNAGQQWRVSGRVSAADRNEGQPGDRVTSHDRMRIELLDPAGQSAASAPIDSDGRFNLQAIARADGPVIYTLRLLDAEGTAITGASTLPLPINAVVAKPARALLLAAVPTPELKYLRRWAADAGIDLDSRIGLAPGLVQGKAGFALDIAELDQLDFVVVDERSWPLIARQRDALRTAVRNGLGLLIRVTGPVPTAVPNDWRALGVKLAVESKVPSEVRLLDRPTLSPEDALHAWKFFPADSATNSAPTDSAPTNSGTADDGASVILLRSVDGQILATQRTHGQGRIGVTGLLDSFRFYTRGERERHATLWSTLVQQIARARSEPEVVLPTQAVIGQRARICGLSDAAELIAPDQTSIPLAVDAHTSRCAAFWPRTEGWYRVQTDADFAGIDANPTALAPIAPNTTSSAHIAPLFYVFDPASLTAQLDEQRRNATTALSNRSEPVADARVDTEIWRRSALLAWLLLLTISWWLERRTRRLGSVRKAPEVRG